MLHKKLKVDRYSQKNIILFGYVVVLSLLGLLIAFVNDSSSRLSLVDEPNTNPVESFKTRFSNGDRLLITADTNINKQAATQAYASKNYQTALKEFQASLAIKPNDPEVLIYWNNSLAKLKGNSLKIATSVPIGGNLNVAEEILRGIAQAQTKINRNGGINGRLIEVEIANDDNDPEIAKQIATEFVRDKKILAAIGHNASRASFAAAPIYQQGKLVNITSTSSAENLPEIGDYIFRSTPSTRSLADLLAEYAIDSARKAKIAICADSQEAASISFKEEFIWSVYHRGGKIANIECDFAAPDFNPAQIPSAMISNGADTLLLAPSIYQVDRAIEVAKANKSRMSLLGNHSMNTYAVLNQGQIDVNGMVLSVAWHPTKALNNSFTQDATRLWGGAVNWRTAMSYDAIQILEEGLHSVSTREQLQQILAGSEFSAQGATEKIELLPSGDRNIRGTLIKVEPNKQSQTGYNFVTFEP
jgi:branched-chain amino acid transport system substrate-binding protein